jgi:hypothetical protein
MSSLTVFNQSIQKEKQALNTKLPFGVLEFSITKTELTQPYYTVHSRMMNHKNVGVKYELTATVIYDLWIKLNPFVYNKNVFLKNINYKSNIDGLNTVTFTIVGCAKEAPTALSLSQGYILTGD